MASTEPLPLPWVQRIFEGLRMSYGAAFDRQWAPPAGTSPEAWTQQLMGYWSRELAGWQGNPAAIRWVMDNLPAQAPSLPMFKALLLQRPAASDPVPRLPVNAAPMPQRLADAMASIGAEATDPKGWAKRILARVESGDRTVSPCAARFAKEALGLVKQPVMAEDEAA